MLLQNSRKSLPLHRVFHSIRFKVNKRLEFSGTPFFMSIPEQKNPGLKISLFKPGFFIYHHIGTMVNPHRYSLLAGIRY